MPAGFDAEVAELFRDLRLASNLSEADLARRLSTRLEVVQALEQGTLYALPPWPETQRVVSAYGDLLRLDVRPLLRRVYAQVEAGIIPLTAPESGRQGGANHASPGPKQPAPMAGPAPQGQSGQRPRAKPNQVPPNQGARPQGQGGGFAQAAPDRRGQPRPPGAAQPGGQRPGAAQGQPQQGARGPQPGGGHGDQRRGSPSGGQPQRGPGGDFGSPPFAPEPAGGRSAPRQGQPARQVQPKDAPFAEDEGGRGRRGKVILLIVLVLVTIFGLGLLFATTDLLLGPADEGSSESGASAPSAPRLDPDDPRSHKADKLPTPDPF